MVTINSDDIAISLSNSNELYIATMTPLKLPTPPGVWYSRSGSNCFSDIIWNAAANQYEVVTQRDYRTQLELH